MSGAGRDWPRWIGYRGIMHTEEERIFPDLGERNDGGSAFPGIVERPAGGVPGMSLRDYFAGQALVGMLANHVYLEHMGFQSDGTRRDKTVIEVLFVKSAYDCADAMLRARAK